MELIVAISTIVGIVLGVFITQIFKLINEKSDQKISKIEKLIDHLNTLTLDFLQIEQLGDLFLELQEISRNNKFLSVDDLIESDQTILKQTEKSKIRQYQELDQIIISRTRTILYESISFPTLLTAMKKNRNDLLKIRGYYIEIIEVLDRLIEIPKLTFEQKNQLYQEIVNLINKQKLIYQEIIDSE